jgi:hypothetical protein
MAPAVENRHATPTESPHERRGVDRRRTPTPVLSRYSLMGGRRAGDRRDAQAANIYVDRYEPWLAAALVAIAALCAFDAVFTLLYIQKGGSEANPIMAAVIEWGPRPFLILKCVITNVGLVILCLHKNFRYVKQTIGALLGIYGALLVYHLWLAAMIA